MFPHFSQKRLLAWGDPWCCLCAGMNGGAVSCLPTASSTIWIMHHKFTTKSPEPLLMKSIFQGDYSCWLFLVNLGKDLTQRHWPVGAGTLCEWVFRNLSKHSPA